MKILNLDELVKVEKVIRLGGKDYPIVEQTLKQTLLAMQDESKLGTDDVAVQVELMKDHVAALVPSLPEDILLGLTFPQLNAIINLASEIIEVENDEGKSKK